MMDRLTSRAYLPGIQTARALIPARINRMTPCEYLTGTDPTFAGLHRWKTAADGRAYSETAHCAYAHTVLGPRDRRTTTIVLPQPEDWWTIIHELGHVLDETLGFTTPTTPVSEYAHRNRQESFAEAFTAWMIPDWHHDRPDPQTIALFDRLAHGD